MSATQKIVKSTKNGQITIPIEFRKLLDNDGESLWQVTLDDNELRVSPVRTIEGGDSDWYERQLFRLEGWRGGDGIRRTG